MPTTLTAGALALGQMPEAPLLQRPELHCRDWALDGPDSVVQLARKRRGVFIFKCTAANANELLVSQA